MSRNLVKQFFAVESEEKRVIDTNELIRRRLETASQAQKAFGSSDNDGFLSGLDAQEIDGAEGEDDSSGNVIKAKADMQALLEQTKAEAQALLNQAHKEAASIVEAAKIQAETEKRNIIEQARHQGYEEGQERANAEVNAVRRECDEKVRRLEEEYQQQLDQLEPEFVDTITSVYEYIFQVDLGSYREILEHLISNTMHKLEAGHNFLIHVSKEDYSYVNMQKKQIMNGAVSEGDTVDVVEDMTLGKNECLIETENGIFDCGLGTQLAELKRRLMLLAWSKED